MVARRAHRGERRPGPPFHHRIDGRDGRPRGPQHRFPAAGTHHGDVIDVHQMVGLRRAEVEHRVHIVGRVDPAELSLGGAGRVLPNQHVEGLVLQGFLDRPEPVGAFGMVAGIVLQASRVAEEGGLHEHTPEAVAGGNR